MTTTATKFQANLTRFSLTDALSAVAGVVPRSTTLPVLSMVRVDMGNDGAHFTATDLDVTATIKAFGEGEGSILVDAHRLARLAKLLPPGNVQLTQNEGGLEVQAGASKTVLMSMGVDEWPAPSTSEFDTSIILPSEVLHDLVARAAFATSTEESRPILNGVLIEIRKDEVRLVATNGHRLADTSAKVETDIENVDLIVHPRALEMAGRVSQSGDVSLSWSGEGDSNHLRIEGDLGTVIARLVEGPYPNWRQVVPEGANGWLTVDRESTLAAVRRSLVTAPDLNHRIRWEVSSDGVEISAEVPDTGTHKDTVAGDYDGDPLAIGFNGEYLTELLSKIDTDEVRVGLTAPEKAVLIEAHGLDARYLLMPLRLLDRAEVAKEAA